MPDGNQIKNEKNYMGKKEKQLNGMSLVLQPLLSESAVIETHSPRLNFSMYTASDVNFMHCRLFIKQAAIKAPYPP